MVKFWYKFVQSPNIFHYSCGKITNMYDIIQNFAKKCPKNWPNLPNLGNFRLFENRFSSILQPGFGFEFKTGIPVFKTDFGLTR